ncbi:carbohydrate-binding module family 13 protein [Rhizophagus clarus]|uniref:Carbohydrate-binding module family 13 protein n=1 Tax=Rhizophagus clarus TaxID=94130 RepID=A0A8H3MC48_9GLOM|nr:carbohydrate-binding module family 13 protein [Rhizophagus clarus]
MYDNKFLPKLSQNLLEILDDDEFYDITIEVVILRYIYGGRLSLEEYDTSDIIKILIAADELSLYELIIHLQSFLIENKKDWMKQNFGLIYKTSFENDSFPNLQNFCIELMFNEPEKIFNTIDFTSLSENCLISLIQHDDFQMDVIQVWEHVLEWGIAQNPGLPSDPSNYSKDDFVTLKNSLQHLIPFIKFNNLTSKEYMDKVYPYKKIIPKDLRENLLRYFMDQQNNNPEPKTIVKKTDLKGFDSNIIAFQHFELISKWIDGLKITDKVKNSYEFQLILRGSRDGFSSLKFHEICDNQSHTVAIIKVQNSNEILGGYNPTIWNSDGGFSVAKNSFIFSFKNKENIEDYILSRINLVKYAIFSSPDYGLSFGCADLELYGNNRGLAEQSCYDMPIRDADDFLVEEYEIFQIIKID